MSTGAVVADSTTSVGVVAPARAPTAVAATRIAPIYTRHRMSSRRYMQGSCLCRDLFSREAVLLEPVAQRIAGNAEQTGRAALIPAGLGERTHEQRPLDGFEPQSAVRNVDVDLAARSDLHDSGP